MKKILLGAAALSVMFATSCKKNDDNNSGPSSNFTLAGTKYTPSQVSKVNAGSYITLVGSDAALNSFSVAFSTAPTSGTYTIVTGVPSASNEVTVNGANGTTANFGGLSGSANVTVNNGKVTVTVPEISALHVVNGTGAMDTVKISGTLIEP